MNYILNMTKVQRKVGIRADEVFDYIAVGRAKVISDPLFDPYYRLKGNKLRETMAQDAMVIANWFNSNRKSWSDAQMSGAYEKVVRIQQGPSLFYQELLCNQLARVDLAAAKYWAEREQQIPGCVDMNLNPDLRQRMLSVVSAQAKLARSKDKTNDLKRILALAFFRKKSTGDFDL